MALKQGNKKNIREKRLHTSEMTWKRQSIRHSKAAKKGWRRKKKTWAYQAARRSGSVRKFLYGR